MAELTTKQAAFVREYLVDLNVTQAAIRAGYSKKTAYSIGHELFNSPTVASAISAAMKQRADRVEMRADDVLRELKHVAKLDPAEMYDAAGTMLPMQLMPESVRRCISSIEETEYGTRYRFWDKLKALELIGKHLKLFTELTEHKFSLESLTDEQLQAKYRAIQEKLAAEKAP
jgi:phage terminase small subunit